MTNINQREVFLESIFNKDVFTYFHGKPGEDVVNMISELLENTHHITVDLINGDKDMVEALMTNIQFTTTECVVIMKGLDRVSVDLFKKLSNIYKSNSNSMITIIGLGNNTLAFLDLAIKYDTFEYKKKVIFPIFIKKVTNKLDDIQE